MRNKTFCSDHGSLNNPSRANGDFHEEIYARNCYKSRVTEEVIEYPRQEYSVNLETLSINDHPSIQRDILICFFKLISSRY